MIKKQSRKVLALIFTSLLTGLGYATPVKAQLNLSDLGGINIWNSVAPTFGLDSTLSADTINTAESLSDSLEDAYAACEDSLKLINNYPRRFARGTRPVDEVCITSECLELENLQREAQNFLESLDQVQQEQLSDLGLRVW
jgi:hypothetical protein